MQNHTSLTTALLDIQFSYISSRGHDKRSISSDQDVHCHLHMLFGIWSWYTASPEIPLANKLRNSIHSWEVGLILSSWKTEPWMLECSSSPTPLFSLNNFPFTFSLLLEIETRFNWSHSDDLSPHTTHRPTAKVHWPRSCLYAHPPHPLPSVDTPWHWLKRSELPYNQSCFILIIWKTTGAQTQIYRLTCVYNLKSNLQFLNQKHGLILGWKKLIMSLTLTLTWSIHKNLKYD